MSPLSWHNTKAGSPCCSHPICMDVTGIGEDKLEQYPLDNSIQSWHLCHHEYGLNHFKCLCYLSQLLWILLKSKILKRKQEGCVYSFILKMPYLFMILQVQICRNWKLEIKLCKLQSCLFPLMSYSCSVFYFILSMLLVLQVSYKIEVLTGLELEYVYWEILTCGLKFT